jgi:carbamate kinase
LKVVIALGGNALDSPEHQGVYALQVSRVRTASRQILEIINLGHQVVVTHGNGPQVGNLALQQEGSAEEVPPQPLHVLGAMTQGQIGYLIQRELGNLLRENSIKRDVVSVVTQVLVDKKDQAFGNPAKPVGPFYDEATAKKLSAARGYVIKRVKPNGDKVFRRVVPSPDPIRIIESDLLAALVENGAIVVASGGGGIPVIMDKKGKLQGVDAVIDKDLAAERLAEAVTADRLLILTDIDRVRLNYGRPEEKAISSMTLGQAKQYMREGHFLAGSMGPKVLACVRFLEWGGRSGSIASLGKASESLRGTAGTQVVPD